MVLHSSMLERMRRQTEDIIRYYGEIGRRISATGTAGVPGLLEMSRQIETAVAVVGSQEIDWVVDEVRTLLDQLVRIDTQLQRLRELKTALDGDIPSAASLRQRSSS
jgi:hypothetical protein